MISNELIKKKKKLSQFLLIGSLIFKYAPLEAKINLNGQFFTDIDRITSAKNQFGDQLSSNLIPNDTMDLTRASLVFNADILSMKGVIELNAWTDNYPQFKDDLTQIESSSISKAYLEKSIFNDHLVFSVGLVQRVDLTYSSQSDYLYGIYNNIGKIIQPPSNFLGIDCQSLYGPISLNSSIWRQTNYKRIEKINSLSSSPSIANLASVNSTILDTMIPSANYDQSNFELGYGARLGYTPVAGESGGAATGFGWSVEPLNAPIVVAVLERFTNGATTSIAEVSVFNYLTSYAADLSLSLGKFQLNSGVNYQTINRSAFGSFGSTTRASSVLNHDAIAYSCWSQLGLNLSSQGYKISSKTAQINKVGTGLEFLFSIGMEARRDLHALTTKEGVDDFLLTVTGSTSGSNRLASGASSGLAAGRGVDSSYVYLAVDNTIHSGENSPYLAFLSKINNGSEATSYCYYNKIFSYVWNANYRPNEQIEYKLEYQHDHIYKRIGDDANSVDSIRYTKRDSLRFRFGYSF